MRAAAGRGRRVYSYGWYGVRRPQRFQPGSGTNWSRQPSPVMSALAARPRAEARRGTSGRSHLVAAADDDRVAHQPDEVNVVRLPRLEFPPGIATDEDGELVAEVNPSHSLRTWLSWPQLHAVAVALVTVDRGG